MSEAGAAVGGGSLGWPRPRLKAEWAPPPAKDRPHERLRNYVIAEAFLTTKPSRRIVVARTDRNKCSASPFVGMVMFAPLDMNGESRADLHRAARLSMLHDRVVKRLDKVDHSADAVEMAAAAFVEATHSPTIVAAPFRQVRKIQMAAGWTLGL